MQQGILKHSAQLFAFALIAFTAFFQVEDLKAQNPMMPSQVDALEEWTIPAFVETMEIELEVICEDREKNFFVITWKDTLGASKGFNVINRPLELHCTVRNDTGVLDYYRGLSTSRNFLSIVSSDSTVKLYFAPGISMFSPEDRSGVLSFDQLTLHAEYMPIEVSLNQKGKQKILLEYNPDIVVLAWEESSAPRPDPVLQLGNKFRKHIALKRYYLNTEDGKIKTGKKYLKKFGSMKMASTDLRIVDPQKVYRHKTEGSVQGAQLIKQSKLELEQFNLGDFQPFEDSLPY